MKPPPIRPKKSAKTPAARANKKLADLFRSLADENRLQIIRLLLTKGKTHVTRICEEIGESQPAVSHHLTLLRHANLVAYERDGKYNLYYIASDTVQELLEHFFPTAAKSMQTVAFGDLEVTFRVR